MLKMVYLRQTGSFLLCLLALSSQSNTELKSNEDSPIVQTSLGPVQGFKYNSSWTKKTIYGFRGIPYAAPPVGDLRFKDPVPPENWTSVMNCSTERPWCMQNSDTIFGYRNITFEMSEDCLYLNVYTPEVPKEGRLLPVMVWIHGGAFLAGSGSYVCQSTDTLVGEGVIVVSLNYRLGALGFLSLGTPEVPGNAGLKDQLSALKWVQREISRFGGDPERVTLFGESAGSASVHLHYLSPLSKGLFHRVIGESGTALVEWAVRQNAEIYGKKLAEILNCTVSNDLIVVSKCLRKTKAENITAAQLLVKAVTEDEGDDLIFTPSVDGNTSSQPFLPEAPALLLAHKQGSFVPFIMGINSDEGMMWLGSREQILNITNNIGQMIPKEIRKQCSEARLKTLRERIKNFYFKGPSSEINIRGFVDLYTDSKFGYSTAISAKNFNKRGFVYLYYFAFNGTFKDFYDNSIRDRLNFSGVAHGEEMNYIFERKVINQEAGDNSNEMKTWRRMVRLWTNFAKSGKPTVGNDTVLQHLDWKPVDSTKTEYLLIDENLTMVESDFLAARVALWDSITPSGSSYLHATGLLVALAITGYIMLNSWTSN